MNLNMPSVPKADIIAVAQAAIAVAVAFGAPLTPDQQKSLLALATVIAAILVTADVKRRGNRLPYVDKIAAATRPALPPQLHAGGGTTVSGVTAPTVSGSTFEDVKVTGQPGHGFQIPTGYTVSGVTSPAAQKPPTKSTAKKRPPAKKKAAPKKKP